MRRQDYLLSSSQPITYTSSSSIEVFEAFVFWNTLIITYAFNYCVEFKPDGFLSSQNCFDFEKSHLDHQAWNQISSVLYILYSKILNHTNSERILTHCEFSLSYLVRTLMEISYYVIHINMMVHNLRTCFYCLGITSRYNIDIS